MNKVQSMANNQFVITSKEGAYFQSYQSIICFVPSTAQVKNGSGGIQLDERFWNYSKTTSKYRNQFLNETTKETERKIEKGVYKLTNLN